MKKQVVIRFGLTWLLALTAVMLASAPVPGSASSAADRTPYLDVNRVFEEYRLDGAAAAGLAFDADSGELLVFHVSPDGTAVMDALSLLEDRIGSQPVQGTAADALNFHFDARSGQAQTAAMPDLQALGAVQDESGSLYVLDGREKVIRRLSPPLTIDLQAAGIMAPAGLARHPRSGNFFVMDGGSRLVELDAAGTLLASFDLADLGLSSPQGMVIAPTGDPTDAPQRQSLYLLAQTSPEENSLRLVELALEAPAEPLAVTTTPAQLLRTSLTSTFNPPSPDPSGIAFVPDAYQLLISDGEVDEMPVYFTGVNMFTSTLQGQLTGTWTTLPVSDEPTGVAYNPLNRHVFYTDDNWRRVYEVNPGADGRINTADDVVTYFSTNAFGGTDPEGIAYNPANGHLYIADGLGEEIYDVAPGPNGRFDGAAPAGDDIVTHFDTSALSLRDPEGVEYNPDSGTLYILSWLSNRIAETTTSGVVLNYIDITAIGGRAEAGIAYGPSSVDPLRMSLYIVDRGVDNGADPYENDGKLYEIVAPGMVAGPTNTPTGTSTASLTPTATLTLPGPTFTPTATFTSTNTWTPTATFTATFTPTITNTPTSTFTPTITQTPTNTRTPTPTKTPRPTRTPRPPRR